MMSLLTTAALLSFSAGCGPEGGRGCTPANAETGIELVAPRGGESFTTGDMVIVSWKVDPEQIARVALKLSATGSNGPWRDIFSGSIPVPSDSGGVCMDTIWTVGKESDGNLLNYGPSGTTVLLRVVSYDNPLLMDESSMITVQR